MYNPFPVSFSKLSAYTSCPTKFLHLNVLKDVVGVQGDAATHGVAVHEAIEKHLRDGEPIPDKFQKYAMMLRYTTRKLTGTFYYEQQLCIDKDLKPVSWTEPTGWYRGILDLVLIHPCGTKATVIDWKTGRPKEDSTQLMLFSGLVFAHYPSVTEVATHYVWLAYNTVTSKQYTRSDDVWAWVKTTSEELVNETQWLPNPSGLCKKHCEVHSCPHNGSYTDKKE